MGTAVDSKGTSSRSEQENSRTPGNGTYRQTGGVRFRDVYTGNTSYEKPEHWSSQAACSGKSHLFDILQVGTAATKGMTEREVKMRNNSNFLVAEKICGECPVIQQCHQSASYEDLRHTYRAGLLPTGFLTRPKGRPSKAEPEKDWSKEVCPNGHVGDWVQRDKESSSYRCRQCKLQGDSRYQGKDSFRRQGGDTCINGHVGMYVTPDSGRRYCKGCSQESNKRRIAARSKARAEARAAKMGG